MPATRPLQPGFLFPSPTQQNVTFFLGVCLQEIVARAESIQSVGKMTAMVRAKALMWFIDRKLVNLEEKGHLVEFQESLRAIPFLPILPKPDHFPIIWKGIWSISRSCYFCPTSFLFFPLLCAPIRLELFHHLERYDLHPQVMPFQTGNGWEVGYSDEDKKLQKWKFWFIQPRTYI